MSGLGWRLLAALLLILIASVSRGQDLPSNRWDTLVSPPATASNFRLSEPLRPSLKRYFTLSPIVRSAGIIFSGRVISVQRSGSPPTQDAASTAITFQIEHAIRGAFTGQRLTIHEWAGLWDRGERYRVGERVLLFLYPASRLGFTSPVSGQLGRFAVDRQDRILLNPGNASTFAKDPLIDGKTIVPFADFVGAIQRSIGKN